jgi:2-dehydro-3-deoxyphosphogluconate aldolase / (4S)-4-hydroxy-2-oxoglutarate aldolase
MKTIRVREEVVARLGEVGIIPIVRVSSADAAARVTDALVDAGLGVIEITMTVPDALTVVASVVRRFGERIIVGAGTVTSAAAADAAIAAGAEFLVTPCLVAEVIAAARRHTIAVLPGALSPTEIFTAVQEGADMVKIFPVHNVGGPAYLRALHGPFPSLALVPTGGVNLQTVGEYIKAGAAAVGVGGELVSREAVQRGNYQAITTVAGEFLEAIRQARQSPEKS